MSRLNRIFLVSLLAVVVTLAMTGTAAANSQTYTVQPGDTLFRIALRFGVTMDAIRAANNFSGDRIYSGQTLVIPDPNAPAGPPPADTGSPAGGVTHIVQPGETLFAIGLKYNLVWTRIQAANNLAGTTVFAGQRLIIPSSAGPASPPPGTGDPPPQDASPTPPPDTTAPPPASGESKVHVVQRGETLHKIGVLYGVPWPSIQQANGLASTVIYTGQRLVIPASSGTTTPPQASQPPVQDLSGRYFLVDLSEQRLYAFEGDTLVRTTLISSGTSQYPTVTGTFSIYLRYTSTRMRGPGYDLSNVPYTMYFYKGYGLHGTYWHNNFGTPMSHGCVNMPTPEAEWAFNWSTYGTPVVVQW
ncbi:MAG: LysM peptidoglycan-binding domain-containing protein [Anaerolineales bacterium]|nr:LysM peptidoglycan-binding domain-containing protein [Anaerolineales bacterium]